MTVKILLSLALLNVYFINKVIGSSDIDPIIYYLLNGEYEGPMSSEDNNDRIIDSGIWKCGQCEDVGESKLLYSETNSVSNMKNDPSLKIQIEVTLEGMKCITVRGSSGIVTGLEGDCEGPSVTLTVAAAEHFVLSVFGE